MFAGGDEKQLNDCLSPRLSLDQSFPQLLFLVINRYKLQELLIIRPRNVFYSAILVCFKNINYCPFKFAQSL